MCYLLESGEDLGYGTWIIFRDALLLATKTQTDVLQCASGVCEWIVLKKKFGVLWYGLRTKEFTVDGNPGHYPVISVVTKE